ncbi:hypothetical protein HYU19_03355 [Candidatus Woesearchaeota archaeon]|nr:hypothetical protein [Candidatus Woesearchaeota archaeon]
MTQYQTTRRTALRLLGLGAGAAALASCKHSPITQGLEYLIGSNEPSLEIRLSEDLRDHEESIAREVSSFLRYEAVRRELGFNPLSPPIDYVIAIYKEVGFTPEFARSHDNIVSLNGILFALQPVSLSDAYHDATSNLGRNPNESAQDFAARIATKAEQMYERHCILLGDQELAWMFRNMLIVHELAHRAWALDTSRPDPGHGVTTRPEVHVATGLYHDSTITRELWLKTLDFYSKFENVDHEPEQNIRDYIGMSTLFAGP